MATLLEMLVPFRRRVLRSALPRDEVEQALAREVEPPKWLRLSRSSRTFEGMVGGCAFDFSPFSPYRRSLRPRIRGSIDAAGDGSVIRFTIAPRISVLVVLIVWLLVALWDFTHWLVTARSPGVGALGPVAAIALVWLAMAGLFAYEASVAERKLRRIVGATRLPDDSPSIG